MQDTRTLSTGLFPPVNSIAPDHHVGELTVSSFRHSAGHRPSTRVQDTRTLFTSLFPPVNSIAPDHHAGELPVSSFRNSTAVHLLPHSAAEQLLETPFLVSF